MIKGYFTFSYTPDGNDSEKLSLCSSAGLGNPLTTTSTDISHPASTTMDHDACVSHCTCQYNCPITNTLIEKIRIALQ